MFDSSCSNDYPLADNDDADIDHKYHNKKDTRETVGTYYYYTITCLILNYFVVAYFIQ